jgi:hypothetical protein
MSLLSVLRNLIFLECLRFLGAGRLRLRSFPRSLLVRFCVDADTCFDIMSEVLTLGVLSAISDKILPLVRNASRPNALTDSLPRLLAPTKAGGVPIEIGRPRNCLFHSLSVNIKDLRRRVRYRRVWNLDPPASGNTVREDSCRMVKK